MAQVTGGSDFDDVWEDKIEASRLILQEFSDGVAARSNEEISSDKILPVILKIFSQRYSWAGNPKRKPLQEWQKIVTSIRLALRNLKPKAAELELELIESQLQELSRKAIESWREGDPEFPKTRDVLNDIVRILFNYRLIKNPPRPTGLMPED